MGQVRGRDPGFFETVPRRVDRKIKIMFLPGETFLLGGRDNLPVLEQRRGAIMIESRDPKIYIGFSAT